MTRADKILVVAVALQGVTLPILAAFPAWQGVVAVAVFVTIVVCALGMQRDQKDNLRQQAWPDAADRAEADE